MPIAPAYTWRQTQEAVLVTVELPGLTRAKTDVFATSVFIKVNAPPYLLALDLWSEIDHLASGAFVSHDRVLFRLRKVGLGANWLPC